MCANHATPRHDMVFQHLGLIQYALFLQAVPRGKSLQHLAYEISLSIRFLAQVYEISHFSKGFLAQAYEISHFSKGFLAQAYEISHFLQGFLDISKKCFTPRTMLFLLSQIQNSRKLALPYLKKRCLQSFSARSFHMIYTLSFL